MKLLLVRYSIACLKLFVVISQDLNCLQRSYHNVNHLYIYYTLSSYKFSHLVELLLVRYSNACLRLFVVVLQDLHCLQRFYHNVDHWCITLYHHANFHIIVELLLVNPCLRLFVVILHDLHCLQRFYHNVDH